MHDPTMTSAHHNPKLSLRELALHHFDRIGLFQFDEGWYQRLEQTLPVLGLRLAAANGLDPAYDGIFRLSRRPQVNARADQGPEYTIYAGAALALIDLGMSLGDNIPLTLEVEERYWDYRRRDGLPGFPDFDRRCLREKYEQVAILFVYGLSFLILHEQSHFTEGHLFFRRHGQNPISFLEATDESDIRMVDTLTLRALEIDADTHATATQLYAAASLQDVPPMTPQWLAASRQDVLASFVGAAAMMGLLTVADRFNNKEPEKRRHPSASLRTMMLLHTYDTYLRECQCNEEEIDDFMADGIAQLRRIYSHLGIIDELGQAVLAQMGKLPSQHPLQQERATIFYRLRDIQPELDVAASQAHDLLGIQQT
jgi:hypothetical protein